ncbi:MAG: putative toxin-antitoxin system toxin component, PIN family [Verrucomicrobiota bacterium]
MERVVVDTNVMVGALLSASGSSRAVFRLSLQGLCRPLMGEKLFQEYCALMARPLLDRSPLNRGERQTFLEAFLSMCEWVPVSFLWRPNLPDEADNHLIELGIAGGAHSIITNNTRDLQGGELKFGHLAVETPAVFLKRWRNTYGNDDDSNP